MALVFDKAGQSTAGNATTISYSSACSGCDRLLLAFIGYGGEAAPRTVSVISYGGVAMTAIPGGAVHDGVGRGVLAFYLINPASGDNVFTATFAASVFQMCAGIISYHGAHQTAPIGAVQTNFSTTTRTPSVTVPSSAGRVAVAGTLSACNTTMSIVAGASRMAVQGFGSAFCYDIGTLDGGGTISWTYTGANPGWAVSGVEIIPSDYLNAASDAFRFYPRSDFANRSLGATVEGTDGDPVAGAYTPLATTPAGGNIPVQYNQITNISLGTYRYLRCRAGLNCYGNIAEVEFYRKGVKVTGTGYGSPGSFGGSGATFDKALDGNTGTFFDAPNPDNQYIGIDKGAAVTPTNVPWYHYSQMMEA